MAGANGILDLDLNMRPKSRSRLVFVAPRVLEDLVAEGEGAFGVDDEEKWRACGLATPLPLPEVLRRVDALHAECNGVHVCGLGPDAFDLFEDWLEPWRAAREMD